MNRTMVTCVALFGLASAALPEVSFVQTAQVAERSSASPSRKRCWLLPTR
jgi:hypothetical protein